MIHDWLRDMWDLWAWSDWLERIFFAILGLCIFGLIALIIAAVIYEAKAPPCLRGHTTTMLMPMTIGSSTVFIPQEYFVCDERMATEEARK